MMRWPWQKSRTAAVGTAGPGYQRTMKRVQQPWQEQAAFYASNLGAVRFACGLMADSGARCILRPERNVNPRADIWEPVEDATAQDVLHAYKGKDQSQADLVRLHIWGHQTVGEVAQVFEPNPNGRGLIWSIRSRLACEWKSNGTVLVKDLPNGTDRDGTARLIPDTQVRRLWIPDETWPAYAVSPLKGVLKDCTRYWALQRRMQRTIDSALGMGKILWTPEEMHQLLARDMAQPNDGRPGTVLERDYYEIARRSLNDTNDEQVESVVPPMMRGPKDAGEPKTVDLSQPFDDKALAWRTEALECIARGLNYPQRLLVSGGADMNHWGAWLMEEQFARNSLAPIMERVCWADLTESFFRPALRLLIEQGLWEGTPEEWRVGFDLTPVVVHPDQSATAVDLYRLGVLSDRELLTVTGFDVTAAPTQAEMGRWVMRTQILRDRQQLDAGATGLPVDATNVLKQIPQTQPAVAAISVPSRERVLVGPLPGEEIGWLE